MVYAYGIYYLIMSIWTYILFVTDKKRARHHKWRIPEAVLLGMSFLGGCIGAYIAMHTYHHKTRHGRFALGVPAMILLHGSLAVFLFAMEYLP